MASIHVLGKEKDSYVEYSSVDGKVRVFVLRGVTLVDGAFSVGGWETGLKEFIIDQNLNVNTGRGLHAFVWPYIENGAIEYIEEKNEHPKTI